MRHTRIQVYVLVLSACAVPIPLIVVGRMRWLDRADALAAERRASAKAFERVGMSPLGPSDVIRSTLSRAWVESSADPRKSTELLDTVSEFLYWSFSSDSPTAYRAWRESYGAELQALEELANRPDGPALAWQWYFGADLPPDSDTTDIFDTLWIESRRHANGTNRLIAIAEGVDGAVIQFSTLGRDPDDEATWPGDAPPRGSDSIVGVEMWQSGTIKMGRPWWRFRHSRQDIIARFGKVEIATVGLVGEFANRERSPLIIVLFWDAVDSRWIVEHLFVSNRPAGSASSVAEL